MPHSRILSVASYLPADRFSAEEIAKRIKKESKASVPVSSIKRLTGVEYVYHRTDENASDLAVRAAKKALKEANVPADKIDLLIFASASQDLVEPATSHIVAAKLGTSSPVFDIKNACNSFLNAVQVADIFIQSGTYKTVLIVTGETPSVAIRWNCQTKDQFISSFPGYSMSDTGGAMILQADHKKKGIVSVELNANSQMWDVGVLGTGGSMHPRDEDATYFNMDGRKLFEAFKTVGCELLFNRINEGLNWSDYKAVGIHQVSHIYTSLLTEELGIPSRLIMNTLSTHGNVASNSLPLQLETSLQNNTLREGDDFIFVGFGGGISTGLGVFKL